MSDADFIANWYLYSDDEKPSATQTGFRESYLAVDWIEARLLEEGLPSDSYGKVFFVGEAKPHHYVYFMEDEAIGIQNTKSSKWPVIVEEDGDGQTNIPDDFDPQDWGALPEEGSTQSEDGDEEDFNDVDTDDDPVEDTNEEGDEEDEIEDGTLDSDADAESEPEELDESDDDADADADEENSEKEPPVIFARMRDVLRWRKAGESIPEKKVNLFKFEIGILNPDTSMKPSARMKDKQVQLEFRQKGDEGKLKIRIPSYAVLEEISPGVYTTVLDLEEME